MMYPIDIIIVTDDLSNEYLIIIIVNDLSNGFLIIFVDGLIHIMGISIFS